MAGPNTLMRLPDMIWAHQIRAFLTIPERRCLDATCKARNSDPACVVPRTKSKCSLAEWKGKLTYAMFILCNPKQTHRLLWAPNMPRYSPSDLAEAFFPLFPSTLAAFVEAGLDWSTITIEKGCDLTVYLGQFDALDESDPMFPHTAIYCKLFREIVHVALTEADSIDSIDRVQTILRTKKHAALWEIVHHEIGFQDRITARTPHRDWMCAELLSTT